MSATRSCVKLNQSARGTSWVGHCCSVGPHVRVVGSATCCGEGRVAKPKSRRIRTLRCVRPARIRDGTLAEESRYVRLLVTRPGQWSPTATFRNFPFQHAVHGFGLNHVPIMVGRVFGETGRADHRYHSGRGTKTAPTRMFAWWRCRVPPGPGPRIGI